MTTPEDEGTRPEETPEPASVGPAPTAGPAESRLERYRRHGLRIWLYTYTFLVAAALVVLIALIAANARQVRYSWVFGHTYASLVWVILVCGVAGWVGGMATVLLLQRRTRRRRRR